MTEEEIIKYIDEAECYTDVMKRLFKEDVDAYGKPKKIMFKLKHFYQMGVAEGFMDAMCK